MKNMNKILTEIFYVSKITKVHNKKLKIIFSAILVNLIVIFDILIILLFASFFSNETSKYTILEFLYENLWLLPVVIIFRFLFVYLEKMNILSLQLDIAESLKTYLLQEVYQKGNYSIADATFFITKLTDHISYFYGALSNVLSGLIQLVVFGLFLLLDDYKTVAGLFAIMILLIIPSKYLLSKGRYYMDESYNFNQQVSRDTERVVENLFLIKILKTEKFEFQNFKENIKKFTFSQLQNYKYGTINFLFPNFIVMFVFSLILLFFNVVTLLTLEFLGVSLRFFQTLGSINNSLNMLVNSHVHLSKILDINKNNFETKSSYKINEDKNSIILKNVSFEYFGMEKPLFENLNLEIKSGDKILISGPNGSGKSTLLGMISNILIPKKGSITTFSQKFSYVGVKPLIIPGTLYENLTYGSSEGYDGAFLLDLVKEVKIFDPAEENLFEKNINNRELSSGQMQKISLIRALISSPDILLLDEATSNVDEESKVVINKMLNELDITVINCAHNSMGYKHNKHFTIETIKDNRIVKKL
jgi:ABC-type multidrug transport system fused ATPase/permease subunit